MSICYTNASKMNVVFVLTAHAADDERVWFHQMPSLQQAGCQVTVVAPKTNTHHAPNMVLYEANKYKRLELMRHLATLLMDLHPDVVVGDTPMALRSALIYRRKSKQNCRILYDVTEWYPSKKNLNLLSGIEKAAKWLALSAFNFWVNCQTDGFIFGEEDKARPFRRLFPGRSFVYTSYYPDLQFVKSNSCNQLSETMRLFYSGNLTEEKGFPNVLKAAVWIARFNPDIPVVLQVLSSQELPQQPQLPSNMQLRLSPYLPFEDFCQHAAENDIFLDLRSRDAENQKCLPIKLFYYMAMGRPVIYSDLKAIVKGCPEIEQFGHLVNPFDTEAIVDIVNAYVKDKDLYRKHCTVARQLAEHKYNWKAIEADFVRFILQDEQH